MPATGQQGFRLLVVNAGASPWTATSVAPAN
jgi:hypothetical protein